MGEIETPEVQTPATPPAPPGKVTPDALRADATALRTKAMAGQAEEEKRLQDTVAERNKKLDQFSAEEQKGYEDLVNTPAPAPVQLPDKSLGPPVNRKNFEQFSYGLLGMSIIGAIAGRGNFAAAGAALNGALKGYVEGSQETYKRKKEEYDREFKAAMEKQNQANDAYKRIIDSKKLSLNMKAQMLRIEAAKQGNEDMLSASRAHNFDKMFQLAQQQTQAAEKMQEHKDSMDLKWQSHNDMMELKRDAAAKKEKANSASADGVTKPGVQAAAWAYLLKSQQPQKALYADTMREVEKIAEQNGISVQELTSASADVKSRLMAKRSFEIRTQNLARAENQLEAEIPVMEGAMKAMSLPSIPIAARGKIKILREMGDPTVTTLDQAAGAVFNEFEGIITGNPGTLNVQDVVAAKEAYAKAQTPETMKAAIAGMRRIITNAKAANDKTREEIMQGVNDVMKGPGKRASDTWGAGPGPYGDAGKEARYQEWKKKNGYD